MFLDILAPPPPDFQLGDLVEFETSQTAPQRNTPRWVHNQDGGSSGIWAKGKVIAISPKNISIKYVIHGYLGAGQCDFPNYQNSFYSVWQWNREGFLRRIPRVACACGSESTYGRGTIFHSPWCPRYQLEEDKFEFLDEDS